jgi:hypothetical protein
MQILKQMAIIALVCYGSSALAMSRFATGRAETAGLSLDKSLNWQINELDKVVAEMDQKSWQENAQQIQRELHELKALKHEYASQPQSESQIEALEDGVPYGLQGLRKRWAYLNKKHNIAGTHSLNNSTDKILYSQISGTLMFWE